MTAPIATVEIRLAPELGEVLLALARYTKWRLEARTLRVLVDGEEREVQTIKNTQKFSVGYEAKDAFGNLTTIQSPVWTASDPTKLDVVNSADGSTAEIVALGQAGISQVRLDGDADLGDGVRPIFAVLDVEVLPGDAVVVEVKPGPVEDQ